MLRELKHAATSPMCLLLRLQRGELEGPAVPPSTCILVNPARTRFHARLLVPGGRFLFTITDFNICLWDLGYTPHAVINTYPIASISIKGDNCNKLAGLQPSHDVLGMILIVAMDPLTT
jgi:hypothetical protein